MGFVGVFDSGIGGLTVLQELRKVAPKCDFLYLADHAFCPYGTKSPKEIQYRAICVATFLQRQGAESIVIACNTASVFAEEIRRAADIPVLDVIAPTCNAVQRGNYKKVALLATRATLQSGVYQQKLNSFGVETLCFNCSSLVPLVESGAAPEERLRAVAECLRGLENSGVEAVILGCTHFPFLIKEISQFCGNARIVSCGAPTAAEFALQSYPNGNGTVQCFTTGSATAVSAVAIAEGYNFSHVEI